MPYVFRPVGDLLEIDVLELTPPLRHLLEGSPDGQEVILEDGSGKAVRGRLDLAQQVIAGPGLRLLGRGWRREPWLYVEKVEGAGPVPRLRFRSPGWDRGGERAKAPATVLPDRPAALAPAGGDGVSIEEDAEAARRLLSALALGRFASDEEESLRDRALELVAAPSGDGLVCLNVVRGFTPFPYQIETARRVIREMRGRALLCDEVGLGKTVEAGLVLLEYLMRGLVRRVLILVPPSLIDQWQGEMQAKFNLDFVAYDSPEFQSAPDPWSRFDRIIASLHAAKLKGRREEIEKVPFDMVIVDEAHHLRNRSTRAWEFVSRLQKRFILLLTATPVQNNLEELFNLVTLLRPGQLSTPREFKKQFVARGDPLQPRNTRELQRLIQGVMVRNRRSAVGIRLPKRRAETVAIALSPGEQALYDAVTRYVRERYVQEGGGSEALVLKTLQREVGSSAAAALDTLEHLAARAGAGAQRAGLLELAEMARAVSDRAEENRKATALVRLLTGLGEQAVVFTGFRATQAFLARVLVQAGFDVVEFRGGMRREEKEQALDRFEAGAQVLLSSEAGGEGRNLQFCRVLVNYDLPWNPMRIEQRIGRLHRIGQQREVWIYTLAARGTVESHILELLDAKINLFELVVGELDMILGEFEEEQDFEDLIMDIWARNARPEALQEAFAALGEELAGRRQRYLQSQEVTARLFGDLPSADRPGGPDRP